MLTPKMCHPSEGKSQSYDIGKVREPLMATTSWGWVLSSRRKSVRASVQESDAAQPHKWFEVYKLLSAMWVGGVEWSWNSRQWWYRLEAVSWLRALGLDDGNRHLCLTFDLPSSPITVHPPATTISITRKLISTQFLLVSSQHTPASNSSCMCVRAGICVGVCVHMESRGQHCCSLHVCISTTSQWCVWGQFYSEAVLVKAGLSFPFHWTLCIRNQCDSSRSPFVAPTYLGNGKF